MVHIITLKLKMQEMMFLEGTEIVDVRLNMYQVVENIKVKMFIIKIGVILKKMI